MVCRHRSGRKLHRRRGHARRFRTAGAYRVTNGIDGADGVAHGSGRAADDGADGTRDALGDAVGNDVADDDDAALTVNKLWVTTISCGTLVDWAAIALKGLVGFDSMQSLRPMTKCGTYRAAIGARRRSVA
jgi:hypothetical protein